MKDLRYPIGKFTLPEKITPQDTSKWIEDIKSFPEKLKTVVDPLSNEQLDTAYRKGGWTVRQLVHHIADSHLNGYTRMKLCLTEDQPTIKPYNQDSWAELPDSRLPVECSLKLISALHYRWSELLASLTEKQLTRELVHPHDARLMLKMMIGQYAWHGNHHLAHIKKLKERKNWI